MIETIRHALIVLGIMAASLAAALPGVHYRC